MNELIRLDAPRAQQARMAKTIGRQGYVGLVAGGSLFALIGPALGFTSGWRYSLLLAAPALLCYLPAIWWKSYLSVLPPAGSDITGRLSGEVLGLLKPGIAQEPR